MDRSNFKEAFFNLSTGTPTYAHIVSIIDGHLVKLISQRKKTSKMQLKTVTTMFSV